ncbi:hypothetical protein L914_14883 [Phytophthora nicotianae]|uniref:Uncharacterized protein n=1 Tax=Phytophthora nicotianae TaxID=4792 RepID=W2MTT8_PHYNI|nr:hypothetical protein L914_14883 [Phytophthora nicotianae]
MRFSNIFLMVSAAVLLTSDLCGATNAQGDIVCQCQEIPTQPQRRRRR